MRDAVLRTVAAWACRRPWTVIVSAAILAAVCAVYAAFNLAMNANTDDLISPDRPYMQDYRAFMDEFGDLESLYVVVAHGGDVARTQACVDAIAERLRKVEGLPAVHSGIEPAEQRRLATRAMATEELKELASIAGAFPAILAPGGTAAVLDDAAKKMRRLAVTGGFMTDDRQIAVGAAAVFELKLVAAALEGTGSAAEIGELVAPQEREYLVSETGQLYFIEVRTAKDYGTLGVIEEPLRRIRDVLREARGQFPDLEIGLTGKPVLQADEMTTTDADMTRASVIAIVLVAVLFMAVIGGIRWPAMAVFALLMAIAWTFGLTTLVVGQLNLLSIVFTLILVGIGIDFGVHIITRYREERRAHELKDALERALLTSGRGNLTGALTSSLAFFMALLTDFRGLQELGFVAGSGLLLCLVSMTCVLPALLLVIDRQRDRGPDDKTDVAPKTFRPCRHPRAWTAAALIATVAVLPAATGMSFEGNLLELQAEGLPSVEWEHRILEDSSSATWFGAAIAEDQDELAALLERGRTEGAIGAMRSVFDVIKPDSPERAAVRASLQEAASKVVPALPETNTWAAKDVDVCVKNLERLVGLARDRAPKEAADLAALAGDLKRLSAALTSDDGATLKARADRTVAAAATFLRDLLDGDRQSLRDSLPTALRDRYVAPSGRLLLAMHPKEDVWDTTAMATFVEAMRRVSPEVTGVPITHSSSIVDMRDGFAKAALLALGAVVLLVLLDFRSLRYGMLAVLPLFVGAAWLVAAMGVTGISFNLANFFAVPILIGLGVDNGIHLVHRHRERRRRVHAFDSTHRGVLLTSCTSMIGFGCLAFATHRGLQSLGQVMALGCATGLLGSLLALPPLLAWLDARSRPEA